MRGDVLSNAAVQRLVLKIVGRWFPKGHVNSPALRKSLKELRQCLSLARNALVLMGEAQIRGRDEDAWN